MIEISHGQARLLISRAADAPLPEEQWAMLQAHLEACAGCRAYRDQLGAMEQRIHRSLRQRWSRVDVPRNSQELALQVITNHERRAQWRRRQWRGALALLAVMAVLLLIFRSRAALPPPRPTAAVSNAPVTTALPLPTPTPVRSFQGVVALTFKVSGKSQIFILNAGAGRNGTPDLTNLTADAGESQSLYPAWSPDGEWLAFLSDRGGSPQLYVINVAGTRLTQLTDTVGIAWQGPLSWSSDGNWIVLTGRRIDEYNTPWIYAVPVMPHRADMPGPRAISGSSNTTGWARFSPSQPLLAVQRADGGIDVFNSELGWSGEVTRTDRLTLKLQTGMRGAFTWALNGLRLVYLADGPYVQTPANGGASSLPRALADANTQMIASGVLGPYVHAASLDANQDTLDSTSGVGGFLSLAYQPGGPLVATLKDVHQTGCWSVHLVNMFQYDRVRPVDLPGLCVLNSLDSAAWTPDGRWLVVDARQEDAAHAPAGSAGTYALNVSSGAFERLADEPLGGASSIAVRPMAESLNIQPLAGIPPPPPEGPEVTITPVVTAVVPVGLKGEVVYSQPFPSSGTSGPRSAIIRINPDGTQRQVLVGAVANNTCPALSPDGKQIAFLSDLAEPRQISGSTGRGPNEIYLMDMEGMSLRQLTYPLIPNSNANASIVLPAYDCPVWSPDGTLIAAVVRSELLPRLDILNTEGQLLRSIPIDQPSVYTSPVWSPNGQIIYLAEPAAGGLERASNAARVASFQWRLPVGSTTLITLPGWDDVQALSVSPDGQRLALVVVRQGVQDASFRPQAALEIFHLADLSRASEMSLTIYNYDPQSQKTAGRLVWGSQQQLTLALPHGPFALQKALLLRFDGDHLNVLAQVPDALYGWALFGDWIVAGTEGGLYGIPAGVVDNPPAPLLLDPHPASGLDGR